jgi:hypothetical protein
MTLDRSYIGYLGFLGIDIFKSVLMYSNGAICLIKLLFDLGLFTVYRFSMCFRFLQGNVYLDFIESIFLVIYYEQECFLYEFSLNIRPFS